MPTLTNSPPPGWDPRVDAYIAKSAAFAQPILIYLRALVHEACPLIEEKIKWGMPSFEYKGRLCDMAAFQRHCSFGFAKGELVLGRTRPKSPAKRSGMGAFGRITKLADLPARRTLMGYVRKAAKLNDAGVKAVRAKPASKPALVIPPDFAAALGKAAAAAEHFQAFSYSKRKDYLEWLAEAKTPATRARRLATALLWIAEGKGRNWKYERC